MRILLDTSVETSSQLQGLPSFFMDSENSLSIAQYVRKFHFKVTSDKPTSPSSRVVMSEKSSQPGNAS